MSDTPQGPGWWQASNGRWYPPQSKPGRAHERVPSSQPSTSARVGLRSRATAKPGVQEPFVFRKMEPLNLDREDDKPRRGGGLNLDRPKPLPIRRIMGIGGLALVSLLVVLLGAYKLFGDSNNPETAAEAGSGASSLRSPQSATAPVGSESGEDTVDNGDAETALAFANDGQALEETLSSVFDLATGDCFSPATETDEEPIILSLVHIFDCEDAHLAEVIKTTTLSGERGSSYPGNAARDAESQRICQDAFEAYVGHTLARSELGLLWLGPTEATWLEQDDRALTCAVQALDGFPLIGSVEDSQR